MVSASTPASRGLVSVLFRGRDTKRCLAEGRDRFELWVGAAVLANNLMRIAALLARPSRKRKAAFAFDSSGQLCAPVPSIQTHEQCANVPYCDFRGCGTQRQCIPLPSSIGSSNVCSGYHWHVDVAKQGPVSVTRSNTQLNISQGAHVRGQAGLDGDLVRVLSLNSKSFSADVRPSFNLGPTLGRDWRPVVSLRTSGHWVDNASVEFIGQNCIGIDRGPLGHPQACAGPVNLGLSDELNRELDKHRDEIPRAAQSAIPCDTVKPKIASQWHPFAIKIERNKLSPIYLNSQPKSAAFSGIVADDNRLRIAVRVGAQTALAADPIDAAVQPLPPLDPLNADQGNLQVNLQAVAPYEPLKQQLRQALADQTFQKEVPGGKVEVNPRNGKA